MANCIFCKKEIGDGMRICEDCAKPPQSDEFVPGEGVIEYAEWGPSDEEKKEFKPEVSDSLVESYNLFQERLSPKCGVVYYPSCHLDSSPSVAFEKSRVIYVDIDEDPIDILKDNGYEAHVADAKKFRPDQPVDVLILLNPGGTGVAPVEFLADQGHVLCNDYHNTATNLVEREDLELVGIIREDDDKKKIFDNENLEQYWEEVSNDDELRATSLYKFVIQALEDEFEKDKVEEIIEKGEVVIEYNKLLESARSISDKGGFPPVLFSLPSKKGHMDDLFVFQKKIKE